MQRNNNNNSPISLSMYSKLTISSFTLNNSDDKYDDTATRTRTYVYYHIPTIAAYNSHTSFIWIIYTNCCNDYCDGKDDDDQRTMYRIGIMFLKLSQKKKEEEKKELPWIFKFIDSNG